MDGFLVIAKIESVYRDSNYVKLTYFTEYPERLKPGSVVYIEFYGNTKLFTINDVSYDDTATFIRFTNFDSAADCELLVGKFLYIPEEDAIPLPEFSYYIHDLIGSRIEATDGVLGVITDVLSYPANDVYVVKDNDGNEMLIPALKDLIHSFSPSEKVMKLKAGKNYFNDEN